MQDGVAETAAAGELDPQLFETRGIAAGARVMLKQRGAHDRRAAQAIFPGARELLLSDEHSREHHRAGGEDLHAPLPSGHDVHWGQGVSDVPAVLAEYRAQGFAGPISVEYEYNWENNAEDAKACIEFVKNWTPPKK